MRSDCLYADNCDLQPCREGCRGFNLMPQELIEYRKAEASAARRRRKRLSGFTDYDVTYRMEESNELLEP